MICVLEILRNLFGRFIVLVKVSGNPTNSTKCTRSNPAGIYLFKVNNRNTRTRCEICSRLTIKTPERRHWHRSGVFIVNFELVSHLVLVFLLLTLNIQLPVGNMLSLKLW